MSKYIIEISAQAETRLQKKKEKKIRHLLKKVVILSMFDSLMKK